MPLNDFSQLNSRPSLGPRPLPLLPLFGMYLAASCEGVYLDDKVWEALLQSLGVLVRGVLSEGWGAGGLEESRLADVALDVHCLGVLGSVSVVREDLNLEAGVKPSGYRSRNGGREKEENVQP